MEEEGRIEGVKERERGRRVVYREYVCG
jgi:hypothetical protein